MMFCFCPPQPWPAVSCRISAMTHEVSSGHGATAEMEQDMALVSLAGWLLCFYILEPRLKGHPCQGHTIPTAEAGTREQARPGHSAQL